ncbi:hypothetical protein BX600DRAFT_320711 [Xylariales sp. PMI_506]|nr:hypothetical protein BX600DRAFT_320711 [Xylariales sp. PMI_506]
MHHIHLPHSPHHAHPTARDHHTKDSYTSSLTGPSRLLLGRCSLRDAAAKSCPPFARPSPLPRAWSCLTLTTLVLCPPAGACQVDRRLTNSPTTERTRDPLIQKPVQLGCVLPVLRRIGTFYVRHELDDCKLVGLKSIFILSSPSCRSILMEWSSSPA